MTTPVRTHTANRDADFIATAREAVPVLIARVRELEQDVNNMLETGGKMATRAEGLEDALEKMERERDEARADVARLTDSVRLAVEKEREACAKIVEGDVVHGNFRQWPGLPFGDRHKDSEIVKFADSVAAAIRSRSTEGE